MHIEGDWMSGGRVGAGAEAVPLDLVGADRARGYLGPGAEQVAAEVVGYGRDRGVKGARVAVGADAHRELAAGAAVGWCDGDVVVAGGEAAGRVVGSVGVTAVV